MEVPLAGLLNAGVEVLYTANHAYVTVGFDGHLPAAFISAVRRLDDGEIMFPPAEVAMTLAIRREQAHNVYEATKLKRGASRLLMKRSRPRTQRKKQ